jgi:long-chain acyl-CoA synthetase
VEYNGHWGLQTGAQTGQLSTISEQDYSIFLNHSEACYCFVSDKITIKLIQSEIKLPHFKDVFSLISLQIVKIGQNY